MIKTRSSSSFIVTGIDTDVGKTIVSAWLCLALDANYWKPVQAGLDEETDTQTVQRLTELDPERFFAESYRLQMPASPHAAAAAEGVLIDPDQILVPESDRNLIIEGAGGLMVPLTKDDLYIDLLGAWKIPVILVIKTYLGCINHSLLSLEALKAREIPLAGIVFNDGGRPESEGVIEKYAGVPVLGRIPQMSDLSRSSLKAIPMLSEPKVLI